MEIKKKRVYKLQQVVTSYNNTEHSSIGGLKPNQAQDKQYFDMLFNLNLQKQMYNKTVTDLKQGDTVRVLDTHLFKKGTEPKWSEETYKVVRTNGNTITINQDDNEVRYKRSKLLKVASD